jgi:branched-subunit amino acid transport protein
VSAADLRVWLIIGLLTLLVILMRNIFLFAPRRWQPRGIAQQALRYAPIAALAALLAPEILAGLRMSGDTSAAAFLTDPRLVSALVLIAVIRLSGNAFLGIAAGTGLFLMLSP